MDHELSELRRALAELGPSGPGRRVPQRLRERMLVAIRRRHQGGASLRQLGEALGLTAETLRRWLDTVDEAASATPRPTPVALVDTPDQTRTVLSLVTPSGFRVEGLSVETAAELLARLR